MPSLFAPTISDSKANPLFLNIRDSDGHSPCRELMEEVFGEYHDKDGNFIKDFQTTGFSARVWELSLFAFLLESGVTLERSSGTPDYVLTSPYSVALEAATSQPVGGVPSQVYPIVDKLPQIPVDLDEGQAEFVFQLGKVLRRKLEKRFSGGLAYWDLPQCRGKPFVLAVQAFHSASSLFHSVSFAIQYLFGQRVVASRDRYGKLVLKPAAIVEHTWRGKVISSGLFQQSNTANLSAVLFSNSGTAAQFNRIGMQRGLGSPDVWMLRCGTCVNPDADADLPASFAYVVGDPAAPVETFAQAMHVVHNPNASIPLMPGAFPGAAEYRLESGGLIQSTWDGFSPIGSLTRVFAGPGATIAFNELRKKWPTARFDIH